MKKSILLAFILLLVVACQREPAEAPAPADQAMPTPGEATVTPRPTLAAAEGTIVVAEGHLVAATPLLSLGFQASGRVLSVAVAAGEYVEAGELIATLDDGGLQDAVTNAEIQVRQAENNLAQMELALNDLEAWEADETAIALAEANLEAAQAALSNAEIRDAAAGNSATSARVNLEQARRQLEQAQVAYDTAWQEARDWELNDPWRGPALEAEREATTRNLEYAQETVEVARAQYNLAWAGINDDTAVSAEANILSAQQALENARSGPTASEITNARLRVEQAQISLEQSELTLAQAEEALEQAKLYAPWSGTILAVDVAPGAAVGAGTPIVTLLDADNLHFHTTNLSERDLGQVRAGQDVEIVLKSYPTHTISGAVARIAPQAAGTIGDAATFTVIIALDPTELSLRPGMTGRAEIHAEADTG